MFYFLGKIPVGYNNHSKTWSELTHRMPLNFNKCSAVNNKLVWNELINFTGGENDNNYVLFSKV